ncbi:MAG TPA: ergothioneine biosynthesis protein EgtB [Polyangiaceae bacterium]
MQHVETQRNHVVRSATPDVDRDALVERFIAVRRRTEELAARLTAEDQMLQSLPATSPTKWHRAHTTWFFEENVLVPSGAPYVDERFRLLFNAHDDNVGPRQPRPRRALVSRPDAQAIAAYRQQIDSRVVERLRTARALDLARVARLVELGLAHEEQHQELILTDILHAFSLSPLKPAYAPSAIVEAMTETPMERSFQRFAGGVSEIGADAGGAFVFDNERPKHHVFLEPFELGTTLVTVGEALGFIADGGYRSPSLWLSDAYDWVQANAIESPTYLRVEGGRAVVFGLEGERVAHPAEPLLFMSWYEADAIARYLGARLPTEAEWEHAAHGVSHEGHFLGGAFHPHPPSGTGVMQMFGTGWEWTSSGYEAYPGYMPFPGALGESHGKFAANERVLRGGSLFTPPGHVRPTYRAFWPPETRIQASAIRLARNVSG